MAKIIYDYWFLQFEFQMKKVNHINQMVEKWFGMKS